MAEICGYLLARQLLPVVRVPGSRYARPGTTIEIDVMTFALCHHCGAIAMMWSSISSIRLTPHRPIVVSSSFWMMSIALATPA